LRADNDLKFYGHLTKPTVTKIESQLPFNEAIIFAILHESIYCCGCVAEKTRSGLIEAGNHPTGPRGECGKRMSTSSEFHRRSTQETLRCISPAKWSVLSFALPKLKEIDLPVDVRGLL
jgi:hypothetical protein